MSVFKFLSRDWIQALFSFIYIGILKIFKVLITYCTLNIKKQEYKH